MNGADHNIDKLTRELIKCGTPEESYDLKRRIMNRIEREKQVEKYPVRRSFPWIWIIVPFIYMLLGCLGFMLVRQIPLVENPFIQIQFKEVLLYITTLLTIVISFLVFIQVDKIFTFHKN